MNQRVTSTRFPYLPIHLLLRQHELDLEALLDTGFDGDLVIAEGSLADLGPADRYLRWRLADGSRVRSPGYLGSAHIASIGPIPIVVRILGDEHLVGRSLTDRFAVLLDHGRRL